MGETHIYASLEHAHETLEASKTTNQCLMDWLVPPDAGLKLNPLH